MDHHQAQKTLLNTNALDAEANVCSNNQGNENQLNFNVESSSILLSHVRLSAKIIIFIYTRCVHKISVTLNFFKNFYFFINNSLRYNIVTFLPFKNVYYLSSMIANQSKNKFVSVSLKLLLCHCATSARNFWFSTVEASHTSAKSFWFSRSFEQLLVRYHHFFHHCG